MDQLKNYLNGIEKVVLISHPSLINLYGPTMKSMFLHSGIQCIDILIPEGESSKSLSIAKRCWQQMSLHGVDRKTLVIALGGGVITDLAGFVAGCYMRGLDVIYIPTTLMGMVDAAIGGKTGINFANQKNLIGIFQEPLATLIDPQYLRTLPEREYLSGLAEVIKYGVIDDESLLTLLETQSERFFARDPDFLQHLIHRSVEIKKRIVAMDFRDNGIRAHLNFGHTYAHALESLTRYIVYLHGEAVAIGMNCAARLSVAMGRLDPDAAHRLEKLCRLVGLPTEFPPSLSAHRIINSMRKDKKSLNHKISLIIPEKMGKVVLISDISPLLIKKSLTT